MSQIIDVTDSTFARDVVEASRTAPVVVDFWAAWCGPCRALGPMLEDVVQHTPGVTLAKLDVDQNPQTAMQFGIRGIPAVKAFRDGRVVSEFVGLQPRGAVEQFLAALVPAVVEELPADEAGLRAKLESQPENVATRRALGTLLIAAGRNDEAEEVLQPAAHDPVSDGLLARLAIARDGDGILPAELRVPGGDEELSTVPRVIAAIRRTTGEERSRLRRVALGVLASADGDARVESLRRDLASALF